MQNITLKSDKPLEIKEHENKVRMTNTEAFTLLVIEQNEIKDRDWTHMNYLSDLVNDNFCHYLKVHPDEYIDFMGKHLMVDKYIEPYIKVQLIFEEKDYITEIMYVEVPEGQEDKYILNEFANLLNINEDKIYGNVIINRSYVSSTNNDMHLDNITPDKLLNSLHKRVNTSVILYDSDTESYKEEEIFGPMDVYAEKFFDDKKHTIKKIDFLFLKHNISVWFTQDQYGNSDVCGKLIPSEIKIDKMIVFSIWTDEYRDSLYLNEFKKIIELSNKLEDYNVPAEYNKEEKDELGRDIIKNKYKILNIMFDKYCSNI
jgi:hypothetical protein